MTTSVWSKNQPRVRQTAERSRFVKAECVQMFAEISGDENPLHFGAAAAKASRFGEIIVHGGITSSILNAVCAEDLPGAGSVFLNTKLELQSTGPARRHHHGFGRGCGSSQGQTDEDRDEGHPPGWRCGSGRHRTLLHDDAIIGMAPRELFALIFFVRSRCNSKSEERKERNVRSVEHRA